MSTRYNQKNKQRLEKETMKGIKICLKKTKKRESMNMKNIKSF